MNLQRIRNLNQNLNILTVNDDEFKIYGKVLNDFDFSKLIEYAENNIEIPKSGNRYIASVEEIENFDVIRDIKEAIYGTLEIEAGECVGQNSALTGLEYHQGSEVTIAVTDCILIVGKIQDLNENKYDTSKCEIFYLEKGQAVELYGTTLHYTPCKVDENGFMTIVVLLNGTNSLIEKSKCEILTKKNKWFITHSSQEEKIKAGSYPGLMGDMIEIKFK